MVNQSMQDYRELDPMYQQGYRQGFEEGAQVYLQKMIEFIEKMKEPQGLMVRCNTFTASSEEGDK